MNFYDLLKLLHVVCVVFSILLFAYRFFLRVRYPEQPLLKFLRVSPHIIDTLLLAAAVGMLVILRLNPLTTNWLFVKIVVLFLYIALGSICLRSAPGSRRQIVFFVLAIAAFSYIVIVALSKSYWLT